MKKNKQRINCIVTDLDDTIWDWFEMWHSSFKPYFDKIEKDYSIKKEILLNDFKKLHQKYHTTEVSFAYKELTSLTEEQKLEFNKVDEKLGKSILHEYYSNKKNELKLYGGVLETLKELKEQGVLIIGYTESNAFFTKTRLKHLELDGVLDYIYTPVGSGIPKSVTNVYPESHWEPHLTGIRHLSQHDKKPNKEILEIILEDFNVQKSEVIYIGDKLDRDIQMAIDTGVTSVYAKYGNVIDSKKYDLLRDVTHWTDEEVAREKESKKKHVGVTITPDFELETSYSEILSLFEFFPNKRKQNNLELLPNVISVWEKAVDVQKHFNDISIIIRNLSLTTFTFIIGGIGYILKEKMSIGIWSYNLPIATIFGVIGIIIIASFYFMDKYWYHRYLVGAVKHASFIEQKWSKEFEEMGLSGSISKESNFTKWGKEWNSEKRFRYYYRPMIVTLFILSSVFALLPILDSSKVDQELYKKSVKQNTDNEIKLQLLKDQSEEKNKTINYLEQKIDSLTKH